MPVDARAIVDKIEVVPTLSDGRFTRHQVENLMTEAVIATLVAAEVPISL